MTSTYPPTSIDVRTEQGEFRFHTGEAIVWERESSSRTLPSDLASSSPDRWLWCLECERAFQLGEVLAQGAHVGCAYEDCGATPEAFWQWESYRAFVGHAADPSRDAIFPLAA